MDRYRIIEVKQSVFADNDAAAERLRGELDAQGTYLINLMSSPGSGKTTTLLRLLPLLRIAAEQRLLRFPFVIVKQAAFLGDKAIMLFQLVYHPVNALQGE